MPSFSAAVILLAAAAAQDPPPAATTTQTKHLTIATSISAPVAQSRRVSLLVDVTPKNTMHVYAPGQDGYLTIALTLEPNPAFTAAKATYPAGEKIVMEILKETQTVYSRPFRIAQDITLRPGAAPVTVTGTLRYQACDDAICYLPTSVPVQWTIRRGP